MQREVTVTTHTHVHTYVQKACSDVSSFTVWTAQNPFLQLTRGMCVVLMSLMYGSLIGLQSVSGKNKEIHTQFKGV